MSKKNNYIKSALVSALCIFGVALAVFTCESLNNNSSSVSFITSKFQSGESRFDFVDLATNRASVAHYISLDDNQIVDRMELEVQILEANETYDVKTFTVNNSDFIYESELGSKIAKVVISNLPFEKEIKTRFVITTGNEKTYTHFKVGTITASSPQMEIPEEITNYIYRKSTKIYDDYHFFYKYLYVEDYDYEILACFVAIKEDIFNENAIRAYIRMDDGYVEDVAGLRECDRNDYCVWADPEINEREIVDLWGIRLRYEEFGEELTYEDFEDYKILGIVTPFQLSGKKYLELITQDDKIYDVYELEEKESKQAYFRGEKNEYVVSADFLFSVGEAYEE